MLSGSITPSILAEFESSQFAQFWRSLLCAPEFLELLERTVAALNPARLQDSLKAAWGDGSARIMLSGPFELDNGRQRILDVYERSRAVPVEPPAETTSVAFAYEAFGGARLFVR